MQLRLFKVKTLLNDAFQVIFYFSQFNNPADVVASTESSHCLALVLAVHDKLTSGLIDIVRHFSTIEICGGILSR